MRKTCTYCHKKISDGAQYCKPCRKQYEDKIRRLTDNSIDTQIERIKKLNIDFIEKEYRLKQLQRRGTYGHITKIVTEFIQKGEL